MLVNKLSCVCFPSQRLMLKKSYNYAKAYQRKLHGQPYLLNRRLCDEGDSDQVWRKGKKNFPQAPIALPNLQNFNKSLYSKTIIYETNSKLCYTYVTEKLTHPDTHRPYPLHSTKYGICIGTLSVTSQSSPVS